MRDQISERQSEQLNYSVYVPNSEKHSHL